MARVGDAFLPDQYDSPITKLKLAADAFALVDAPLAADLMARAGRLGLGGTVDLFDGQEAQYFECYRVLQGAEIWQSLGGWITEKKPRFAADIAQRFASAAVVTPADVAHYALARGEIRARFESLLPADTAILMPVTPCPALSATAPPDAIGDFYHRALTLTSVAGHCGAPQFTLPLDRWRGCPIGLSVLGRRGSDRALLELAATLAEQATAMALA